MDHPAHREQKSESLAHLESTDMMVKRENPVFVGSQEETVSKAAKEKLAKVASLVSSENREQTETLDHQVHVVDRDVLEKMVLLDFQVYQDWMDLKVQLVNQVELESKVPMVSPDVAFKELPEKMAFKDVLVCQAVKVNLDSME